MPDERESRYQSIIQQFPDSPMGYFSLGRYYLELGRHADAATQLRRCVELQSDYAAALVSLGDALVGAKDVPAAKAAYAQARAAAMAQNHPSLAEEIDERTEDLA
jgi:cytochrome c-type biogenesis protein CcmH/NrfG